MDGNALDRAREAFAREAWSDAFAGFRAAEREGALSPAELEASATAAYLLGRDSECADLWTRAHNDYLSRGEVERAVRCAFWLGLGLLLGGEQGRGAGWIARAQRLLDDSGLDCVERGLLLLPNALGCLAEGDFRRALATFSEAADIGACFHDPDLVTLGRLGRGQALIGLGEAEQGVSLLDEMMVALETERLTPIVVGIVYCAAIEACWDVFDLRRAQEWTTALSRWCDAQPDLVPFRGQCLLRRAELMQLHGAWSEAREEARQACERLQEPPGQPAAGAAFYRQAELHRLGGDFSDAEAAYREASRHGRPPQPGLAQLRLAQGRVADAAAALQRVLLEDSSPARRCALLSVQVEVMLVADDVDAARAASDELSQVAAGLGAPLPLAAAAHATGAVRLAEGDPRGALDALEDAWNRWTALDAPYEAARTRVLMGLACRALGDRDGAELELDGARTLFQRLGAAPDLAHLEALESVPPQGLDRALGEAPAPGGLTPREQEVLRLVAAGKTNRAIAADLFISEKTVARHLSNILAKLGLSTRTAATAWAYRHDLV